MSSKRPARTGNPDLRQQKHVPAPPIAEIQQKSLYTLAFIRRGIEGEVNQGHILYVI
ncbi:hypothetical protein [Nostoc sp.]